MHDSCVVVVSISLLCVLCACSSIQILLSPFSVARSTGKEQNGGAGLHSTTVAAWYRFGNLYGVPWNFGKRSAAGPVRLTSPHRQVTCQPGMEYGVLGEYQRRARVNVDVDGLGTCRVKQQTRSTGNSIGIVHGTGHRTGRVRT